MALYRPPCGNCCYNCCCICWDNWVKDRDDCYICKKKNCADDDAYRDHYVCFQCNIGWKTPDYYLEHGKVNPKCQLCGADGTQVGRELRIPKKNDKKQWALIERVVLHAREDVEKSLSVRDRIKLKQKKWYTWVPYRLSCKPFCIVYPKRMSDYDRFIEDVKKNYFEKK